MLLISDLDPDSVVALLQKYQLNIEFLPDGQQISGSFWGEPEAGIIGDRVFVRADTPVHSLLHEVSHIVCMTPERRAKLHGNAGGDDPEECAVCFMQIILSDELPGVGAARIMQDMDDWGYNFRLGSVRRWFERDAEDARGWLRRRNLLRADLRPTFRLRQHNISCHLDKSDL
jgi:hypothetical protein